MIRFSSNASATAAAFVIALSLGAAMQPAAAQTAAAPAAAAPAAAATAPAAPAAAPAKKAVKKVVAKKTKAPVPTSAPKGKLLIDNRREAVLEELTLTSVGATAGTPQVIAHDLGGGGRAVVSLPKGGGCVYDVEGSFDDAATFSESSANLCTDRVMHLTE